MQTDSAGIERPMLTIYNTMSRTKEPFSTIEEGKVRMYVCGPTVYDLIHIGNARPLVVFDVLFRLLRLTYGEGNVTYVRNITDVDDKINQTAAREGVPIGEVTDGDRIGIFDGDEIVGDMPVQLLVDDCPLYDLEPRAPGEWIYGNRRTLEATEPAEVLAAVRRLVTLRLATACARAARRRSVSRPTATSTRSPRRWPCRTSVTTSAAARRAGTATRPFGSAPTVTAATSVSRTASSRMRRRRT